MEQPNKTATTRFETPTDREIVVTRVLNAPRSRVWEAWTSPKHLPHWMTGPPGWKMTTCEYELSPGGASRLTWSGPDGAEMTIRGVNREIVPPERLVATESWGPEWPETLNTLLFTEEGGKTTVTLTILYPTKETRDAALQSGMSDGMAATFDTFDRYLQSVA